MIRNIHNIEFPEGIKSIYVNGKHYSKEEFVVAQKRSKFRDRKGRFIRHVNSV
tara:strand:- start:336 stop:494 length:159 start_codon:yes stop_codon:yes gene_type:complete